MTTTWRRAAVAECLTAHHLEDTALVDFGLRMVTSSGRNCRERKKPSLQGGLAPVMMDRGSTAGGIGEAREYQEEGAERKRRERQSTFHSPVP